MVSRGGLDRGRAEGPPPRASEPRATGVLGGMASFGVPFAACPACWPAYVGLASAAGLGFLTEGAAVVPFTVALLVAALVPLGRGVRSGRSPGLLALGVAGAVTVVLGQLALGSDTMIYTGAGLLIGASAWNVIPRRSAACEACAPGPGPGPVRDGLSPNQGEDDGNA